MSDANEKNSEAQFYIPSAESYDRSGSLSATMGRSTDLTDQQSELMEWWQTQSERDLAELLPKVGEYGAFDLQIIGDVLATMSNWDQNTPTRVKEELGCFFYLLGKVARMASAYRENRLPSDDTYHDAEVYAKMVRRIRDRGEWG